MLDLIPTLSSTVIVLADCDVCHHGVFVAHGCPCSLLSRKLRTCCLLRCCIAWLEDDNADYSTARFAKVHDCQRDCACVHMFWCM
jgi:hypothetical protein